MLVDSTMHYTQAEEKLIAENLARTDVRISQLTAAIFVPCLLFLPVSVFWYWFIPLAAFYVRMHYLVMKREEALDASMRERGLRATGGDRGHGSVAITQGSEQARILRQ